MNHEKHIAFPAVVTNVILAVAALTATACGAHSQHAAAAVEHANAACPDAAPRGLPDLYRPQSDLAERSRAAELCRGENGLVPEGYIRVRGDGDRDLVMGREALERGACTNLETLNPSSHACPEIFADAFGRRVVDQLLRQGIQSGGIGAGACVEGVPTGNDVDDWGFSISVYDWADAETAVKVVAAELDRLRIDDSFGVSVRGVGCAQPLW